MSDTSKYADLSRAFDYLHGSCTRKTTTAIAFFWHTQTWIQATNGPVAGGTCRNVQGNCGCQHAEVGLIHKMVQDRMMSMGNPYADIICTLAPCENCANMIATFKESLNITGFYWLREYHDTRGLQVLRRAGIHVERL